MGRCNNFPASFSARESALKFLSASAAAAAVAAVSALAGVRVGVSYSPALAAAGEVEGVCAQFWASTCNFGENNWFYPVFRHFLSFSEKVFVF